MFKTTFHFSIFIAFLLSPGIISGQVTGVKYFIKHNTKTNLFDCHLIITEGSATSTIHRTQFNAQYSIVAPSGSIMQIAERYFPLQDHQTYTGTKPCEWKIASVIRTPEVTPDKDYFGIVPTLGPSAQYDNIKAGDTIKIFSISVEPKPKNISEVRIFDNASDPTSSATGMRGANFGNGFTIGGITQCYTGNHTPTSTSKQKFIDKSKNKDLKMKSKG